ncbi:MAG: hypothetical protein LUH08_06000 [Ruminococcus sp.]|nr:hypothetical protein [Ruminococcus sp.]
MPSTMIHLVVANEISRKIDVKDSGQFYLGAIAPDTVNLNGKASKEVRYSAHLRSVDVDEWIENIIAFTKENKQVKLTYPDFFKGFIIHLLTDIAWDKVAQPELFEAMRQNGVSEDKLNDKKWNELLSFDRKAVKSEIWTKKVRPQLKSAHAPCGLTVDKDKLEEYKGFVLNSEF